MISICPDALAAQRADPAYRDKSLLVIGTGGVKRTVVFRALRALGLGRIVCLHDEVNWAAPYVDEWIVADSVRPEGNAAERVAAYLAARPGFRFDGIFTIDEYSVLLTSHLVERFGGISTSVSSTQLLKNKAAFRRFCREQRLPSPGSCEVPLAPDPDLSGVVREGLRFPLVVKPAYGAGSLFVRRVDDVRVLEEVVARYAVEARASEACRLWPALSLVVEEYIDGAEVDIDMLVQGGTVRFASISDNQRPIEPYFMELGGQTPSALSAHAQHALISTATDVLAALGVRDACVHFEARSTAAGPVPIEVNLRIGGAEVHQFSRAVWGVDLLEGAVRIALGLDVPRIEPRASRHAASINFIPAASGRVRAIRIDPRVAAAPALEELTIFKSVGEVVKVPPEGFEYLGWMVASGETEAAAHRNLADFVAGIHFDISGD